MGRSKRSPPDGRIVKWRAAVSESTTVWQKPGCFTQSPGSTRRRSNEMESLLKAKVLIEWWRQHYNTIRPHSALGYRPPAPEAWQPRAFASATPQQTHGAGLLEGKILT